MTPELLIAGCGYVGSALAHRELEAGRRVMVMSRSPLTFPWLTVHETKWTSWVSDFTQVSTFPGVLPWTPQVGVFLVSPGLRQGGDVDAYQRALNQWNEWCTRMGIRHKIMAGSIGVYEQQDGSWVTEKTLLEAKSERAQHLLEAEWLFMLHTEMAGETGIVLRIGGIYGPERHRFLRGLGGDTESEDYLNLIWRDDLVTAIQACASGIINAELKGETGKPTTLSGVYNVTDGAPARKNEIARFVNSLTDGNKPPDQPKRSRGQANRRVSAELFRRTFHWTPEVVNYREGYQLLVREASAD